jgi:hypothetical protein
MREIKRFALFTCLFTLDVGAFQRTFSPIAISLLKNPSYDGHSRSRQFPSGGQALGRSWQPLIQIQASDVSLNLPGVIPTKTEKLLGAMKGCVNALMSRSFPSSLSTTRQSSMALFRKCWWIFPMFLAVVPLYVSLIQGTTVSMPHWWQVVRFDGILASQDAALVVACFLLSNISYFLSGLYLLKRFPPERNEQSSRLLPTRFTILGLSVLACGLVSTIFHSVQALGAYHYSLAESWCYVDHAFAISTTFYFFETCGRPSRLVWALGLAGLVALAVTYPGYAWLHSSWHLLSSAAATVWGVQGGSLLANLETL